MDTQFKKSEKNAVNLGLFYNAFLAIIKTIAGIFGNSSALLADGINSTSDVVYYIAVKIFLKIADKPADKEHPFGHKQMELIASIVISAFIITTAITIAWNSISTFFELINGTEPYKNVAVITLYIAIFTFISKIFLSIYTKIIGKKTRNPAISALAFDHINDIFASLSVIIGISFALKGINWVDPLAGVLVSLFILKTGIEILKDAANGLMDVAPDKSMKELVRETAKENEKIIDVESIFCHRYGKYYSLNITIGLDGSISMNEADILAEHLEKKLLEKDSYLKYVFIHYHPSNVI